MGRAARTRRSLAAPGDESAPPRPRERLLADVVEAGLRRRLVFAGSWQRRAPGIAALAPRLQRPTSAEGVSLPRRRRRGSGPVRIRPAQRARRRAGPALAVAPTRRELSPRGRVRRPRRRALRHLHGTEGNDHLLQHVGLPPRRLRDGKAACARDVDMGLPRVTEGAVRAELRLRPAQRCGVEPGAALRADLKALSVPVDPQVLRSLPREGPVDMSLELIPKTVLL